MNTQFSRCFTEANPFALFVYGTLQRGYSNNHILAQNNAQFVCPAVTDERFIMSEGHFPRLWRPTGKITQHVDFFMGHCCGELWAINQRAMDHCDRLEGHPRWYLRQPTKLHLFGGETLVAQGYIMQDKPDPSDWQVPNEAGFLAWGREPTNDGSEYEIESGADAV